MKKGKRKEVIFYLCSSLPYILFRPILIKPLISNVASRQIDDLHISLHLNVPKYLCFHVNYTLHFRKDYNSQTPFRISSWYHTSCTDMFTARVSVVFHVEKDKKILRSTIYSAIRCFFRKLRIISTNNVLIILDETNIMRYTKICISDEFKGFRDPGWFNNRSLNTHKIKIYFFSRKIGVILERLVISSGAKEKRKTVWLELFEKFFRKTSYTLFNRGI